MYTISIISNNSHLFYNFNAEQFLQRQEELTEDNYAPEDDAVLLITELFLAEQDKSFGTSKPLYLWEEPGKTQVKPRFIKSY